MTESPYITYIELKLIDHVSPGMASIAAGMKALQKHFDKLTAGQKALSAGLVGVMGGSWAVCWVSSRRSKSAGQREPSFSTNNSRW